MYEEVMGRLDSIGFVIPAYNEASSISAVVKSIVAYGTVIVVDDGSTDGTAELARRGGAVVLIHEKNRGYEAALHTGIRYGINHNFGIVLTLDADGQHNLKAVEEIIAQLSDEVDLVVGSRDCFQRRSEAVFGLVGRLLMRISDPLCGLKGYRVDAIRNIDCNTYESIGTELAIRLVANGNRWSEVRVNTLPRVGLSRFGDGLKTEVRILRACWRSCILFFVIRKRQSATAKVVRLGKREG